MASERGFQEISVTRLGYQTPAQRFGALRNPHAPPADDSDSEDEQEVDEGLAMPRIEEWRMNLTALSQYHNLYFVAYGEKIHVYRPQGSRQTLPSEPCLIIDPPQSREAIRNNSLLSRYHAHIINHLAVGNLGDKEILLFACHDGDVIAFYTDAIENAIQACSTSHNNIVKPFFAENVGNSAWGMAIHAQSRLIAIGSNSHEVSVFALALSSSTHNSRVPSIETSRPPYSHRNVIRFPEVRHVSLPRTPDERVSRDHNFRLVLKLKPDGDNIPSIDFSDNIYGDAETVIAKDIKGALWFLSIWEDRWKRLPTVPEEPDPHINPKGWGVTVLPRNFFKPTRNQMETFGCPKFFTLSSIVRQDQIDISKSISVVKDSTIWHEAFDTDDDDLDEDEEDDDVADGSESDPEDEVLLGAETTQAPVRAEQDYVMFDADEMIVDTSSESQQAVAAAPATMSRSPRDRLPLPTESHPILNGIAPHRSVSHIISSGALIIHSNRHSVTLLPTDDPCPPTHCHNILRQEFPHDLWFPRPLTDYDRLNMIANIPELSLVLVASQIGRVALLTITRPVDRESRLLKLVSMRVDLILPFAHEETDEKVRPSYGLLGMAVGPMQGERARMENRGGGFGPRRWRLMLHYFNHAVLSYELSRDEESEELLVL